MFQYLLTYHLHFSVIFPISTFTKYSINDPG